MKHMSGPWAVHANRDDYCYIVYVIGNQQIDASHEESDACARLMAAAPDLLDALKMLGNDYDGSPCFCQMSIGNPMMREHSWACLNARNAIKKAEGGA